MSDNVIHDKPSQVENAAGVVMVSGPDGVAVSMTPEAAAETGSKLIDNAAEAQGKVAFAADLERRQTERERRDEPTG